MFHKAWQFFSKHCASASGSCNPGIWQHATPRVSSISTTGDAKSPFNTPTSESGSENPEKKFDSLVDNKNVSSLQCQGQAQFCTPLSFLFKKTSHTGGDIRKNRPSNDVIPGIYGTEHELDLLHCARPNFLDANCEFNLVNSLQWLATENSNVRRDLLSGVVESNILSKPIQFSSKLEELVLSSDDDDVLPNIEEKQKFQVPKIDGYANPNERGDNENRKLVSNLRKVRKIEVKKQECGQNVRSEAQLMLAGTELVEQLHSEALNEEAISILRGSNPGAKDLQNALRYLQQSADLGNSKAMFNLAVCFETGRFGELDYYKALELYEKAWLKGNEKAGHNLKLLKLDMLKLDSANKTSDQG